MLWTMFLDGALKVSIIENIHNWTVSSRFHFDMIAETVQEYLEWKLLQKFKKPT